MDKSLLSNTEKMNQDLFRPLEFTSQQLNRKKREQNSARQKLMDQSAARNLVTSRARATVLQLLLLDTVQQVNYPQLYKKN